MESAHQPFHPIYVSYYTTQWIFSETKVTQACKTYLLDYHYERNDNSDNGENPNYSNVIIFIYVFSYVKLL